MVYGDGDTAKSVLALTLAAVIASGTEIAGIKSERTGPVLYLDWEDDEFQHARRLHSLCAQHGIDVADAPVYYQRMETSMKEAAREVKRKAGEVGAIAVVIDSAGMASGGDPMDAQAMIASLSAARAMALPTFVIHHLKKDATTQEKKAPYGSVYARNEVRLAWLVETETENDEVRSVYTCTKGNWTGSMPSVRLAFNFTNVGEDADRRLTGIEVRSLDWQETTDIQPPSQRWQIMELLRSGGLSVNEIGEALNIKQNRVRAILNDDRNKEMFVKVGTGKDAAWGNQSNDEAYPGTYHPVPPPAGQPYPDDPPSIGGGLGVVARVPPSEKEEDTDVQGVF